MMVDVLLDKPVDHDAARRALARLLHLPIGSVRVVDLEEFKRDPTGPIPQVLVEITQVRGDFRTLMKVSAWPESRGMTDVEIARGLAAALNASVLVGDGSADPYAMLMVDQGGAMLSVELDARALDRHSEYRLKSR